MIRPGDVVTVEFPGAQGLKRRPAVVVSSEVYQAVRPDVVIAILTTQLAGATTPTDYALQDWSAAGLRSPTAFRSYFATVPVRSVRAIGRLSDRDLENVAQRLRVALAV